MKSIKNSILLILAGLIFYSIDCRKREGENCHHKIIVKNNSLDTVIFALLFTNGNGCNLSGSQFYPHSETTYDLNPCWEDELSTGKTFKLYVVDYKKYNKPEIFYNCDSIETQNRVLQKYDMTLTDLQRERFTIIYQ